jgi:hypothetical protein
MGQVWRARDSQTNRVVALKVLPEHSADNDELRQRFRRECQAVAQPTEPHVIPIHDFGDIDGRLYLNMGSGIAAGAPAGNRSIARDLQGIPERAVQRQTASEWRSDSTQTWCRSTRLSRKRSAPPGGTAFAHRDALFFGQCAAGW